jgi:hypothetical protein
MHPRPRARAPAAAKPAPPTGPADRQRQTPRRQGIDWNNDSQKTGAYAIVLSGGYKDDHDKGAELWYTGEGGQKGKKQVFNQEWTRGNLALRSNKETGQPVRLIRGKVRARALGGCLRPFLARDPWGPHQPAVAPRSAARLGRRPPAQARAPRTRTRGAVTGSHLPQPVRPRHATTAAHPQGVGPNPRRPQRNRLRAPVPSAPFQLFSSPQIGPKNERIYVYEGLYRVTEAKMEPSTDGPLVCRWGARGARGGGERLPPPVAAAAAAVPAAACLGRQLAELLVALSDPH